MKTAIRFSEIVDSLMRFGIVMALCGAVAFGLVVFTDGQSGKINYHTAQLAK